MRVKKSSFAGIGAAPHAVKSPGIFESFFAITFKNVFFTRPFSWRKTSLFLSP
jgi:hypothetical protein